MAYERMQLDCGCEVYVDGGSTTRTCQEAKRLTDALCEAVEKWLPTGGAEDPSKMEDAQAADRALSQHLAASR